MFLLLDAVKVSSVKQAAEDKGVDDEKTIAPNVPTDLSKTTRNFLNRLSILEDVLGFVDQKLNVVT